MNNFENPDHPYHKHYGQALQGIEGVKLGVSNESASKQDIAATLVKAGVDADFDKDKSLRILAGKHEGTLFAVQGEGPAAPRALVFAHEVQPGAAKDLSETLKSVPSHNQVISQVPEEKIQYKGPSLT
jgi:hypothetical protein